MNEHANPVHETVYAADGGTLAGDVVGTRVSVQFAPRPRGAFVVAVRPPAGPAWTGLGNPAGSRGYRYNGAGTSNDPCAVVLVKKSVVKGVCIGSGVALMPPFSGDVGIVLVLGTTDRYCARFGGKEAKNDPTLTKRKNAAAPVACP